MTTPAETTAPAGPAVLVSRRRGRSTNGTSQTSVWRLSFEDDVQITVQIVVETDSYERQNHVAVRPFDLATQSWGPTLVWLQGRQCASWKVSADLTAGRLAETMRVMRDEGHEKPYETLLSWAIDEDERVALADAVEILSSVHGALRG